MFVSATDYDISFVSMLIRLSSLAAVNRFEDTAAILISVVLNSYYGMLYDQMQINLPPEHPIMYFETIEIKMAVLCAKRSYRIFKPKWSQEV